MCILLGKNNVRLFDFEKQQIFSMSYEEFYKKYHGMSNCKIIVDRSEIDFSLEYLKNCNLIDAYKILRCRIKMSKPSENVFLIRGENCSLFKKNNFYIQNTTINDLDFYKKIDLSNGIFFIENIIAEFSADLLKIDENTWWLYVAEHQSGGTKFVAGLGKGIVFSRIIEQSKDSSEFSKNSIEINILKTLQYIKRFGFKSEIKIISAIDNLVIENQAIEVFDLKNSFLKENIKNPKDIEIVLIDFLFKSKNIREVFVSENFLKHFLKNHINKIFVAIFLCFFILMFSFFNIQNQVCDLKHFINNNEKTLSSSIKDSSNTFEAKIDAYNFEYIQYVIDFLKESKNPIDVIKTISIFLQKHKIQIEKISIERCNNIKMKCCLNKTMIERLKKLSNDEMEINVARSEKQNNNYEIIDDHEDKNFGADICIKLK